MKATITSHGVWEELWKFRLNELFLVILVQPVIFASFDHSKEEKEMKGDMNLDRKKGRLESRPLSFVGLNKLGNLPSSHHIKHTEHTKCPSRRNQSPL